MKKELIDLLIYPVCKNELTLDSQEFDSDEIVTGVKKCVCGEDYKIKNEIPRFVKNDKYVE